VSLIRTLACTSLVLAACATPAPPPPERPRPPEIQGARKTLAQLPVSITVADGATLTEDVSEKGEPFARIVQGGVAFELWPAYKPCDLTEFLKDLGPTADNVVTDERPTGYLIRYDLPSEARGLRGEVKACLDVKSELVSGVTCSIHDAEQADAQLVWGVCATMIVAP
jgi:hypothetical protein